ncbi:MAG: hypothetical protein R2827_12285 [Bdellovibrionales bacterium]
MNCLRVRQSSLTDFEATHFTLKGLWSQSIDLSLYYGTESYSSSSIASDSEMYSRLSYDLNYQYSLGLSFRPAKSFNFNLNATAYENTSVGAFALSGQKDFGSQDLFKFAFGRRLW